MALSKHITNIFTRARMFVRIRYRDHKKHQSPFYRCYPYLGKVRLQHTDRRGLIDKDIGFFYNFIPKAASSTIKANLTSKNRSEIKSGKPSYITPSQLSQKQIDHDFQTFYKFTFVRNPYTRMLSAYIDKILKTGYFDKKPKAKISKAMLKKIGPRPSFHDFLFYLENGGLYSNIHWAPQTSIFLIPVNDFDFIGKVEKINTDLQTVLHQLFQSGQGNIFRYSPHATQASHKITDYYDSQAQEIVYRLYKDDFETLNYQYELPIS